MCQESSSAEGFENLSAQISASKFHEPSWNASLSYSITLTCSLKCERNNPKYTKRATYSGSELRRILFPGFARVIRMG